MDDNKLVAFNVSAFCATIISLAIAVIFSCGKSEDRMVKMVEAGANPIAVRCTLNLTENAKPMCTLYVAGMKEQAKEELENVDM